MGGRGLQEVLGDPHRGTCLSGTQDRNQTELVDSASAKAFGYAC